MEMGVQSVSVDVDASPGIDAYVPCEIPLQWGGVRLWRCVASCMFSAWMEPMGRVCPTLPTGRRIGAAMIGRVPRRVLPGGSGVAAGGDSPYSVDAATLRFGTRRTAR